MMTAIVPPSIGEAPNSLAALIPTKILMPQKAALPAIWSNWISGADAIAGSAFKATFKMPVISPQAIKAGISGKKMLAMRFNRSLNGVAFFLRIFS